jgi:hypothetical protein
MTTWYEAKCSKQILWKNKNYSPGDKIKIIEADMQILWSAGVIGDMKKIQNEENLIEQTIVEAPENEMRPFRRKARP